MNIDKVKPIHKLPNYWENIKYWYPETASSLFAEKRGGFSIEKGFDFSSLAGYLIHELEFASELPQGTGEYTESEKMNLLFAVETLGLCGVSNILSWRQTSDGVEPAVVCEPFGSGAETNICDTSDFRSYRKDITPYFIDSERNIKESLQEWLDSRPSFKEGTLREIYRKISREAGVYEYRNMYGSGSPYCPVEGQNGWGGAETFLSPLESCAPMLEGAAFVKEIKVEDRLFKEAAEIFLKQREAILSLYKELIADLIDYLEEKDGSGVGIIEEKTIRFSKFFRFIEKDMWETLDYLFESDRARTEYFNDLADGKESVTHMAANNWSSKIKSEAQSIVGLYPRIDPNNKNNEYEFYNEDTRRKPKTQSKNRDNNNFDRGSKTEGELLYDTKGAAIIWKKYRIGKNRLKRDMTLSTIERLRRHYEDLDNEFNVLDFMIKNNIPASEYKQILSDLALITNGREPGQTFFSPTAVMPLEPEDVEIIYDTAKIKQAVSAAITEQLEKYEKRSVFSKREQEDELRAAGLIIHGLVCTAVDIIEGRSPMKNYGPDLYSSLQRNTMDNFLDGGDNKGKFRPGVMVDAFRVDRDYSDKRPVNIHEWGELENLIPAKDMRPYTDRVDVETLRQLLFHGNAGTPLTGGEDRSNVRSILPPRILKWRLRDSLKDLKLEAEIPAHVTNSSLLPEARRGVFRFVLDFCNELAKNAQVFNCEKTEPFSDGTFAGDSELLKRSVNAFALDKTALYFDYEGSMLSDKISPWEAFKRLQSQEEKYQADEVRGINDGCHNDYGDRRSLPLMLSAEKNEVYNCFIKGMLEKRSVGDELILPVDAFRRNTMYMPFCRMRSFPVNKYTGQFENIYINHLMLYNGDPRAPLSVDPRKCTERRTLAPQNRHYKCSLMYKSFCFPDDLVYDNIRHALTTVERVRACLEANNWEEKEALRDGLGDNEALLPRAAEIAAKSHFYSISNPLFSFEKVFRLSRKYNNRLVCRDLLALGTELDASIAPDTRDVYPILSDELLRQVDEILKNEPLFQRAAELSTLRRMLISRSESSYLVHKRMWDSGRLRCLLYSLVKDEKDCISTLSLNPLLKKAGAERDKSPLLTPSQFVREKTWEFLGPALRRFRIKQDAVNNAWRCIVENRYDTMSALFARRRAWENEMHRSMWFMQARTIMARNLYVGTESGSCPQWEKDGLGTISRHVLNPADQYVRKFRRLGVMIDRKEPISPDDLWFFKYHLQSQKNEDLTGPRLDFAGESPVTEDKFPLITSVQSVLDTIRSNINSKNNNAAEERSGELWGFFGKSKKDVNPSGTKPKTVIEIPRPLLFRFGRIPEDAASQLYYEEHKNDDKWARLRYDLYSWNFNIGQLVFPEQYIEGNTDYTPIHKHHNQEADRLGKVLSEVMEETKDVYQEWDVEKNDFVPEAAEKALVISSAEKAYRLFKERMARVMTNEMEEGIREHG